MYQITTNESQAQIPEITQSLDELAREGARRMIQAALELEVDQHIQAMRHLRDENDHALVVRNGKARPRDIHLGSGRIEIQAQGCMMVGQRSVLAARFCHLTCAGLHN